MRTFSSVSPTGRALSSSLGTKQNLRPGLVKSLVSLRVYEGNGTDVDDRRRFIFLETWREFFGEL